MKKLSLAVITSLLAFSAYTQNVGIGTTTPETKLHVADTVNTSDGTNGAFINVQNTTITSPIGVMSGIRFRLDGIGGVGTNARYKGGIYFQKTGLFGVGTLLFATNSVSGNSSITAADARMAITSGGDVGVGITAPNYRLHVTGGDLFLQTSAGKFIMGYDGSNQWRFATTGGGADLLMSSFNGTTETFRHYFGQNGYVGLGTGSSAGDAPLHVKGTTSLMLKIEGSHPYAGLYDNTDGYKSYWWYNGTDVVHGSLGTSSIRLAPGNSYSTTFYPDGRVAMGGGGTTVATGYILSVRGKIISEELKVQLNGSWPDYVFKKDYKLPSLENLEQSIMRDQHLPNIPSAAQVEKDGILVGDMNKRLLEKIEELTLYLIDLNKKNTQLTQEVEQLKKQMQNNK